MMPMSPSFDTAGVIASDAPDARLVFELMAGERPHANTFDPLDGVRIGIARDPFLDAVDPAVAASVERAAAEVRGRVVDVRDVPVPWIEDAHNAWLAIALAEFSREYRSLIDRVDELDPSIAMIFNAGLDISAEVERDSLEAMVVARGAFERTMSDVDVLLLAATPHPAPHHEDQMIAVATTELAVHLGGPSRFAQPVNVVAAPAIVLPSGFSSAELPLGIQFVGRRGSEELLLALGSAYQAETDWHTRVPPLHA
jgi:aspartyl-tRNA(Asn)/glutamyl-tRNA(Gln) amidotransferase subunit A